MTMPFPLFSGPGDVANALRAWTTLAQGSLRNLYEPILPGWTINVDSFNSSSPETERDVLKTASYGRQLGRISDAVAQLIQLEPSQDHQAFKDFDDLQVEIGAVKAKALAARVARMPADLLLLKTTDAEQFGLVRAALLAVL
jgi:hypothetical protein